MTTLAPRGRYLRMLSATVAGAMIATAAVNLVVDPYGYFGWLRVPGFNAVKPRPEHDTLEVKRAAIGRAHPNVLILGNSRAEVGFDPEHPAWAARKLSAYNFALAGSTIAAAREVLDEQAPRVRPRLVVVGVEFLDFLADPARPATPSPVRPATSRWDDAARIARALFTWDALADSIRTIAIQRSDRAATITDRGFNPLAEYVEIAGADGYHALFRQRAMENAAQYARRPRTVRTPGGEPGPAFGTLRAILRTAAAQGAEVDLVIYPYHAQLLLLFDASGLWPAFEDWKRQLVALVDDERARSGTRITLWDFSGFSPYATEAIPPPGDRTTATRWYWEAGHFKRALGDRIISEILGTQADAFGVRLDPANVEGRLAALRAERDAFRAAEPELAREVRELAEAARRREAP